MELSGESDCPQHPERVVGESYVGIERRAKYTRIKVYQSIERVDKLTKPIPVQAYRHGVDCKITAAHIIIEGAILYNGIAGVARLRFPARTHKFKFKVANFYLRCAVIGEYGEMSLSSKMLRHGLRQLYA